MKNIFKKLMIGTMLTAMAFVAVPSANTQTAYAATKSCTTNSCTKSCTTKKCTFSVGKLKYKITGKNTCTVVGLSKKGCNTTSCSIPSSVTCNGKTYKVKSIANKAFANCDTLKTVKIANGVNTIGTKAFYNCDSLKKVCLGNSINTIKNNAFSSCDKLSSISCSNIIKNLGTNCFGSAICKISK